MRFAADRAPYAGATAQVLGRQNISEKLRLSAFDKRAIDLALVNRAEII